MYLTSRTFHQITLIYIANAALWTECYSVILGSLWESPREDLAFWMRRAVRSYLGMYRRSTFLVYDKRAGRLMGAVISKEEFGMVSPNVCFNLILRLTMKSKKRKAVK